GKQVIHYSNDLILEPTTVTFQFTDFEITPILEEISQISDLPLTGRAPLTPRTTSGIDYLQSLGLRIGRCLFGRQDSYDRFQQEFFISRVDWERLRAIVFIWASEHFYQRRAENGTEATSPNKIRSHVIRLNMWDAPNNEVGWRIFLTHLTGNHIQWRLPWVHGRALLRTNQAYFIELIGLEGFQPYAPLRVLRQFGITQGVPLWSNMTLIEVNYEGRVPIKRIAALVQEWCGILDSDMEVES
ncbi:hypothetical protein H5410_062018, partial [Solanum commersonii]